MSPSAATITMPPAIRPQPARRVARSRSGATRIESASRTKATIGRRMPSRRSCSARWAIWASRSPVVPCPTVISPEASSMRWASSGLTTAIAAAAWSTASCSWITRSAVSSASSRSCRRVDRPAEDVPEAVAGDDPAHHGPHERLGPLGLGAAAGDQLGGQGVGEVVLDVGRGERRLGPVAKLARVEELAAHIEHDRPEDDRHDRQAEQDAGADPAPARARRARVTGSARRSWLRHQRQPRAGAPPATLLAPPASTTAPAVTGGGPPVVRCAVRPCAIPSSRPPVVVGADSCPTPALRPAPGRAAPRPPRR